MEPSENRDCTHILMKQCSRTVSIQKQKQKNTQTHTVPKVTFRLNLPSFSSFFFLVLFPSFVLFLSLPGRKPSHRYILHDGLVNTVRCSPFFEDIILTVGGWTFAIWKEGVMVNPTDVNIPWTALQRSAAVVLSVVSTTVHRSANTSADFCLPSSASPPNAKPLLLRTTFPRFMLR